MKKYIFLLTIVVILPIFTLSVTAEDLIDDYIDRFDEILPDELSELGEDGSEMLDRISFGSLFDELFSFLEGREGELFGFLLSLLSIVILFSLASLVGGGLAPAVECAVALPSSLIILSAVEGLFSLLSESISDLSEFFSSLIPITVGITALGGGVESASVQAGGMYLSSSLFGGALSLLLSSFSSLSLSLALISSIGGELSGRLIRALGKVFNSVIGVCSALCAGLLSLQTLVASAADSAAMRAAKYMASGLIPVVGSTLSGALSTLSSGLGYAKGVIGGGAVAAILMIAIPPILLLLCYRFALSLAIFLSQIIASPAERLLTAFRTSLDILIAFSTLSGVVYLFNIILFIKIGIAIA